MPSDHAGEPPAPIRVPRTKTNPLSNPDFVGGPLSGGKPIELVGDNKTFLECLAKREHNGIRNSYWIEGYTSGWIDRTENPTVSDSAPLTPESLAAETDALLAAAEKMTPGKWIIDRRWISRPTGPGSYTMIVGPTYENPEDLPQNQAAEIYQPPEPEDMEGIITLHNSAPALLRAWLGRCAELQEYLDEANRHGAEILKDGPVCLLADYKAMRDKRDAARLELDAILDAAQDDGLWNSLVGRPNLHAALSAALARREIALGDKTKRMVQELGIKYGIGINK